MVNRSLPRCRKKLIAEFGRGFDATNLTRMMKFAKAFPYEEIVATLSQQLSWSHFRELLPLEQPLQREFYAEMCRMEGWSVRTLRGRIDSMLYERTSLSRKPEERKALMGDTSRSGTQRTPRSAPCQSTRCCMFVLIVA